MRLLRHTMRSPPPALARAPHRQYMDIDFTDAPVDLHWLTFENYYTATVTVLSAEVHPTTSRVRWIPVVSKLRLMADCHAEDDAQRWHKLHASQFEAGFDPTKVVRLRIYMLQPSPSWRSYTLHHLAFYTVQPAIVPVLLPEPDHLTAADRERSAKLAGVVAQLATMAHEIRATLAAVAPQRGGTLDACSLHVLGEWSDELVELAPLQSVGEREMNRTASSGRSAGAGVPPVTQ